MIKNLISIKLFFLKFDVNEKVFEENNKIKIFNDVQYLISRMMKYYYVFHDLVTFKYEVKLELQKETIKKNQENFNLYLLLSLKGLGYFNINSIIIHINLKSVDGKSFKNKIVEIELKENEKISITKSFIFKLTSNGEEKEMAVEIDAFYIFQESLKFKFVSVAKKLNN
jgi:hypothetical protein